MDKSRLDYVENSAKINFILFFLVIWSKNKEAISPLLRTDGVRLDDRENINYLIVIMLPFYLSRRWSNISENGELQEQKVQCNSI